MKTRRSTRLVCAVSLLSAAGVQAQAQDSRDLTEASLQDLMAMKVTSVSKKEQSLSKTAAAVYVITQEDIRRSGMTNIPDLLRMVPGVDVARIDANTWAISIRGFNYRYSTKVLVLIDGRTVYTPAFSGVYWDQQSVPLENIERIEVIRGPGGTMWGANAVNGVINIITKSARDTQGGVVSAGTGSQDSADGFAQYGGTAGSKGFYRGYSRYFSVRNSTAANGGEGADGWHGSQGGFRSDWSLSRRDALTVQGDISGLSEGQTVTTMYFNQLTPISTFYDKARVDSENLLGRWTHTFDTGSQTSFQMYYDRFRRDDQGHNVVETGDADFQYHFNPTPRHDVVAGAEFRLTSQTFRNGYDIRFGSGYRADRLYSGFVQDEIRLSPSLALVAGSKFEHNAYTGFEYEPSAQLLWTPMDRHTVWASASKAVEQPSWYYQSSVLDAALFPVPGAGPGVLRLSGDPQATAPELWDFEAGYRAQVSSRVSLDLTGFYSDYQHLHTLEPLPPAFSPIPEPHVVFGETWQSLGTGHNYGIEVFGHWDLTNRWRLSPGYSFLQMKFQIAPGSQDTSLATTPGDSPKHQFQLRSTTNLRRNVEWDSTLFYVSTLGIGPVRPYWRVDTRLGWHASEDVEISVGGQNLLTPHHIEFLDALQVTPTQADRSAFARITWRF